MHRRLLLPALIALGCLSAAPAVSAQEWEYPPPVIIGTGDGGGPWADHVASSTQGRTITGDPVASYRSNPGAALGVAERQTESFSTLYSLGYRGELVLGFDNAICNGTGPDFGLSSVSSQEDNPQERADIFVSADRVTWTKAADDVDHTTNVALPSSVPVARFVKIVDGSGDGPDQEADGYDVDGVRALNTDCAAGATSDLELSVVDDVASPVAVHDASDLLRIQVRNEGPDQSQEQELKLTFRAKSGLNPAMPSISSFGLGVSPCAGLAIEFAADAVIYRCRIGALGPNGIHFTEFNMPQDNAYELAVRMEVRGLTAADMDAGNDVVTRDLEVFRPKADFKLAVTDALSTTMPATTSDTAAFKVTNTGPDSARLVMELVSDHFGTPPLFYTVTPLSGCDSYDPGSAFGIAGPTPARCVGPQLAPGASHLVSLKIGAGAFPSPFVLKARVAGPRYVNDPVPADNEVSQSFTVTPVADMRSTLTGPSTISLFNNSTGSRKFTGTISNLGPTYMPGSELRFIVKNLTGSIVLPSGCTQTTSGTTRTVRCAAGEMHVGDTKSFSLTINPSNLTTFTVQTSAYPHITDPNASNNDSPVKTVKVVAL